MPRLIATRPAASVPAAHAATPLAGDSPALHSAWGEGAIYSTAAFAGAVPTKLEAPLASAPLRSAQNFCLLIDDNPNDQILLVRELEKTLPVASVHQAADLPAFRESLAGPVPAVVLLDWSVRYRKALALLHAGRERWPSAEWIIFTHDNPAQVQLELDEGGLSELSSSVVTEIPALIDATRAQLTRALQRHEAERIEVLHSIGILDTPIEEDFDRLVRQACTTLHAPMAQVALIDVDRQWLKSSQGLAEPWSRRRQTPLSHSLCTLVVSRSMPVAITDTRTLPQAAALRELGIGSYLGVPLVWDGGWVLGSLCVMDRGPRQWLPEEEKTLRELSVRVLHEMRLRYAAFGELRRTGATGVAAVHEWDEAPFGVALFERKGRAIRYANATLGRWLGRDAESLSGVRLDELHPANQMKRLHAAVSALGRGTPTAPVEVSFAQSGPPLFADAMLAPAGAGQQDLVTVFYLDAGERRAEERKWRKLANAVFQAASGPEFFRSLVLGLVNVLGVDMAAIGLFSAERREWLRIIALCDNGELSEDLETPFTGHPCEHVLRHKFICVTSNFRQTYPGAEWMIKRGVESYLALPLVGTNGETIGVLKILHRAPLKKTRDLRAVMQIFATRATAELERMRAAEALHESRQRMELALRGGELGTWDWDLTTDRLVFDERFAAMLGFKLHELPPHIQSWSDRIHPEDKERVMQIWVDHAAGRAATYEAPHRLRTRDGSWIWIMDRGRVVERDSNGRPIRACGTHLDISEHKRTETSLRLTQFTVDHAVDSIFWISPGGQLLYVNDSACRMLGYSRAELLNRTIHDLDPNLPPSLWPAHWEELKRSGSFKFETTPCTQDGRILIAEVTVNYLHFDGREYNCAIMRDVTAARLADKQREQFAAQLRATHHLESLGTLAGGIAHDINNLLTPILGCTELALGDLHPDHPVQPLLADVKSSAVRARDLVRQILGFSSHREQPRHPLYLQPIVREAQALLLASVPANVKINATLCTARWQVLGDATQLHQIVMNLGTNAWHALGEHTGAVDFGVSEVTVTPAEALGTPDLAPGDYVRLTVADNGSGMDAATLARIFEPFFTTKAVGQGTGLGLAVVHGIVKESRGAITVTSAPGQGTVITIFLPAMLNEVPAAGEPAFQPPSGRGQRILVLDDKPVVLDTITQLIDRIGYCAKGFTEPREALAAIRANPEHFDVVLTDLSMPDMSGLDLAADIHVIRPDLPILLMTGFGGNMGPQEVLRLGFAGLLMKPLTLDPLRQSLAAALRSASRELAGPVQKL